MERQIMIIPISILLSLAIWIAYKKSKTTKMSKQSSKEFWDRESRADSVRKKDISNLPYVTIPYDDLPFGGLEDDAELKDVQDGLRQLGGKRIINFTGYTNTDLKLEYGAANLPFLSEYDQNFTIMTRLLFKWASLLIDRNDIPSAKKVLSFAIECGTDISGTYTMLAKIYSGEDDYKAVKDVIDKAENIRTTMKDSVLEELNEILYASPSE